MESKELMDGFCHPDNKTFQDYYKQLIPFKPSIMSRMFPNQGKVLEMCMSMTKMLNKDPKAFSVHHKVKLDDGGSMCWINYLPSNEARERSRRRFPHKDVVLLLFATLTCSPAWLTDLIDTVTLEIGWPVVLINKRGQHCPLESPCIRLVGDENDTQVVYNDVKRVYNNHRFVALGISAGCVGALRFVCSGIHDIVAFAGISGGINFTTTCPEFLDKKLAAAAKSCYLDKCSEDIKQTPFYREMADKNMSLINFITYSHSDNKKLTPEQCKRSTTPAEFAEQILASMRDATASEASDAKACDSSKHDPYSGLMEMGEVTDIERFMWNVTPGTHLRKLKKCKVMLICSRNDLVFEWDDAYGKVAMEHPDISFVVTKYGSHGCYFKNFVVSGELDWAEHVSIGFLQLYL